jgi:pimeloyl-ACP methyl ester carboxylesterase
MRGMLARLQQFMVFALLGSALSWAAHFIARGKPGWAVAGVGLILLGYALFLGAEFVVLRFVQTDDERAPRPRNGQLAKAWLGEVLTAPRVFFWRQPFRSRVEPDLLDPGAQQRAGVVLVHGFVCNRGLWTPWLRQLRARGVPFVAVNLEPVFGSIDAYATLIEAAVARVEAATGQPVILVGHSMGGLAIRRWLATFDADARVRRVITIGTPHQGTWLARHGHTLNGKQMRLDSDWLRRLAASETPARRARFSCFFGHCDNIVFPSGCGTLPNAHNVHVPGVAHVQMAFQPIVFGELLRWLEPNRDVESTREAPALTL